MTLEDYEITRQAVVYSSLFLVCFGLWKWRHLGNTILIVVVLKIASLLCDQGGHILSLNGISPNYAANLYAILATSILMYFYYRVFAKPELKKLFMITGILLCFLMFINWFFIQKNNLNSYSFVVLSLLGLLLGLLFYFTMIKNLPEMNIIKVPLFWINTGQILYSTGTLLLFIVTDYLVKVVNDDLVAYWSFHNGLAIISNIFFFVGIWLGARRSPEVASPENP